MFYPGTGGTIYGDSLVGYTTHANDPHGEQALDLKDLDFIMHTE